MYRKSAVLGLVAVAVLSVAAVVLNVSGTHSLDLAAPRAPVLSRELIFRDAPSGDIAVFDRGAPEPFEVLPREQNRFMATALRLLAQERTRRSSAGPETPFVLTRWSDGLLSLNDPATGEALELAAFGHTNAETFAPLLDRKAKMP